MAAPKTNGSIHHVDDADDDDDDEEDDDDNEVKEIGNDDGAMMMMMVLTLVWTLFVVLSFSIFFLDLLPKNGENERLSFPGQTKGELF